MTHVNMLCAYPGWKDFDKKEDAPIVQTASSITVRRENCYSIPKVRKIVYINDRETVVTWADGKTTHVSCGEGETFDKYTGFMAAVMERLFGSTTKAKKLVAELDEGERKRREKEAAAKARKEREAAMKIRRERAERRAVKRLVKNCVRAMKANAIVSEMVENGKI